MLVDRPPRTSGESSQSSNDSNINHFTLVIKDDLKSLLSCVIRPMLYFYQGIAFITLQTGFWFYLSPLINLLSLDLFAMQVGKEGTGVCFLQGLKSIDKELWYQYSSKQKTPLRIKILKFSRGGFLHRG
eukprot:328317_1